jgi:prepilin-type N-terminal cleavage/methylation domain-containing protein
MKTCKHKFGLTLVEMLIAVGIIAILASMIISIAGRIQTQDNERLTESTFALLNAALQQFRDYGYNYGGSYQGFDFPLDCNDFDEVTLRETLEEALGLAPGDVIISGGEHDPNYSGSEALYFFLSRVPTSRKTLDRIDSSLITNKGLDKQPMNIDVDGRYYPLLRFIDPWGKTLRYSYYDNGIETSSNEPPIGERRTFPVITSSGPDREFGTPDDLGSR